MTSAVRSEIAASLVGMTAEELVLVQKFIRVVKDKVEPRRRDVRELIRSKISAREAEA